MNRLKELRIKHGLNQKEVADALDTTQQAISLYESGKREPKLKTWQKLADYFNVSTSYLMGLNSNDFGNRIKELRIKNGLSQAELAEKIGVKDNTICQYEKGKRHPNNETWQKLADCFNVSIPSARGEINVELIAKIAKMIFLTHAASFDVYLNKNDLFTGYDEDDTTIACKLMLLLLQQLNLNISEEYEKIVDKTEKILGKSDSDPAVNRFKTKQYLSDITDGCPDNNFEKDIEDAKKIIDFYDKL
ncbi:helix-turn-helix domain-containing protein [Lactobacillus sp.]|uniref:helix-turn-helix domain-containing protein n=1 Tax=Lactobacillus sp. TaxID=1591 RepID=UPI0025856323|nr:helix-turn-helix transcriptional regulator [Lactobacillus sp.]MCO6529053.1 helix-turn-helix transcriptional regulator [Lactobacillus sp.]